MRDLIQIIKEEDLQRQMPKLKNRKGYYYAPYIPDIMSTPVNDFNFDLERMKEAVESKRIPIPPEALTSEEAFDKWLNEDNDEPTN